MAAGDSDDEVYCICDSETICYDAGSGLSKRVQVHSFVPSCMTYKHGFCAAGGLEGQLEVKSVRENGAVFKESVGNSINNALHITEISPGDLRLFVCSNDKTVKVYRLPSMSQITAVRLPVAVNYCASSPDGQYLACVGDNPTTVVYESTSTGYQVVKRFREWSDVGMCCSWSPAGALLAAVSQDGVMAVWDVRSSTRVALMRRPAGTACRNIKFSPGPVDLLAFSEQKDAVHVVDARRWDAYQSLTDELAGQSASISGIAFSPRGTRLYVGLEAHILQYDIDTCARRRFGTYAII